MNIRSLSHVAMNTVGVAIGLGVTLQTLSAQAAGYTDWTFSGTDQISGYTYSGSILTGDGPYYNPGLVTLTYLQITAPGNSTLSWPGDLTMAYDNSNTWNLDFSTDFFGSLVQVKVEMNDLNYNNLFQKTANDPNPFLKLSTGGVIRIEEEIETFKVKVSSPEPSEMFGLIGLGALGLGLGIKKRLKAFNS